MHPVGQFFGQRFVDGPMLGNTGLSCERFSRDSDTKMGFTPFAPAGMAHVAMRFVDDLQMAGRKSAGKLFHDTVVERALGSRHGGRGFRLLVE